VWWLTLCVKISKRRERYIKGYDNFFSLSLTQAKVCHHGSKTSSTKEFVDKVNPKYSIIQVGRNSYGHPSEITLKTLEDSKTEIYRNDMDGCVRVKINENIKIDTTKME